ncbi:phosphatidylinositol-glycan biosynthesis class W protein-like [Bombina bombina]|uniref:phosphatidylinositol-glycan biosynthesis class W protein-like n=1 Tax=Bombina bombina TaxID=8345 RepID=UPI00235A9F67|nr:phosphatidylinositol-glycan biosynthesis class W protein-like [Bombina bombina]
MSYKLLKESFISNLNGTSLTEITVDLSVPPLLVLCRGLLFILHHQRYGERLYSWKVHLFLDFILLILPQVMCCTVLADNLYMGHQVIVTLCVVLLYTIYRGKVVFTNVPFKYIWKQFQEIQVDYDAVPAVTSLRVLMNLYTAVYILAVDFPIFPRRYAKTETYGTGTMDIGVGCFIFANSLVSPEAKGRGVILKNTFSNVTKQLFAVWPLIALGLGRLISVKTLAYHEHVSEYGVHWNFFFTLAVIRVMASLLLTLFPVQKAWILAITLLSCYQAALETTNLKKFILHGSDGKGTRIGFLNANREGLFSLIGYTGIYMAGVQVGLYVLKKRTFIKDWMMVTWNLMLMTVYFFIVFNLVDEFIEPVSRRMANLTFCIWIIALCLFQLCLTLLVDLIIVFVKSLVSGSKVSCTWDISKMPSSNKKQDVPLPAGKKKINLCLIEAVNRNQLLFFLLSNIMTGLVNMLVDTIYSSSGFAISVLLFYMFTNCLIAYVLHITDISVKCW